MAAPKYAKKADGNQKAVLEALRHVVAWWPDPTAKDKVAPCIWVIGEPLDVLIITKNHEVGLLEIKDPSATGYQAKRKDQPQQVAFLEWTKRNVANIARVESIEQAVQAAQDFGR